MTNRRTWHERIPIDLRWEIWERDDFRCLICGARRYLTIDHIIAVCDGGETTRENLQTLCKSCNCRKEGKQRRQRGKIPPCPIEMIPSALDRDVRYDREAERWWAHWQGGALPWERLRRTPAQRGLTMDQPDLETISAVLGPSPKRQRAGAGDGE